ncbi:hypothetical protein [Streptomyces sp. NPDC017993]|uniref:hypothetical protein n=1 Tax=Streptomyces sp. NPDC017993 TaxID=3365027 RepID=UPI003790BBF4
MTELTDRTQAPFLAEAFLRDGHWHLRVTNCADAPEVADLEGLTVTLAATEEEEEEEEEGFPEASLNRRLAENGFTLAPPEHSGPAVAGTWQRVDEEQPWTVGCYPLPEGTA